MKTRFSTLIVTTIANDRFAEETPYSHRKAYLAVAKMILGNKMIAGGYSHRLIKVSHEKANFTRFIVLIGGRDMAQIDIHTMSI